LRDKIEQLKTLKAMTEQREVNLQSTIEQLKREIKGTEEYNKDRLTKLDR
jgi:predicted flavoprotein YhiN